MSAIQEKKYIDYSDIERYYQIKEETTLKNKTKSIQRQNHNNIIQIKYFVYAAIIFGLALGIIYNYATITQIKMEINDLNKAIVLLDKQKEDVLISLESIKNSNIIENNATNYLGMNYAKNSQNSFISINYSSSINDKFTYNNKYDESALFGNIFKKTFRIFANEGI